MSAFHWAALALILGLAMPGFVCMRKGPGSRLVALDIAASVGTLAMLTFAAGSGRSVYFDVAVASSVLAFASGLVFARFLELWV